MLVGRAIKNHRDDAFISVKFGAIFHMDGGWGWTCGQSPSKTSSIIP
jgi:aryl-alcohol dehydrogenase-like predicted oxidoreductase